MEKTTTRKGRAVLVEEQVVGFGPLDFRRELFRTARSFQKVIHDAIGPVCKDHGVTVQQMHVLLELVQQPGQTASSLSERAGILHTNFAMVCRKLEDQGLLERHRSDVDRRSFELEVTDAGRVLLRRIDDDIERLYGDMFEAEPHETFDAIVGGFRAMRELVEKFGR